MTTEPTFQSLIDMVSNCFTLEDEVKQIKLNFQRVMQQLITTINASYPLKTTGLTKVSQLSIDPDRKRLVMNPVGLVIRSGFFNIRDIATQRVYFQGRVFVLKFPMGSDREDAMIKLIGKHDIGSYVPVNSVIGKKLIFHYENLKPEGRFKSIKYKTKLSMLLDGAVLHPSESYVPNRYYARRSYQIPLRKFKVVNLALAYAIFKHQFQLLASSAIAAEIWSFLMPFRWEVSEYMLYHRNRARLIKLFPGRLALLQRINYIPGGYNLHPRWQLANQGHGPTELEDTVSTRVYKLFGNGNKIVLAPCSTKLHQYNDRVLPSQKVYRIPEYRKNNAHISLYDREHPNGNVRIDIDFGVIFPDVFLTINRQVITSYDAQRKLRLCEMDRFFPKDIQEKYNFWNEFCWEIQYGKISQVNSQPPPGTITDITAGTGINIARNAGVNIVHNAWTGINPNAGIGLMGNPITHVGINDNVGIYGAGVGRQNAVQNFVNMTFNSIGALVGVDNTQNMVVVDDMTPRDAASLRRVVDYHNRRRHPTDRDLDDMHAQAITNLANSGFRRNAGRRY
jgi:hypothetical protein